MDFMEKVERQLDLPPIQKSQVMRELKSHYEELKEELIGSGMSEPEAEAKALRRLGEPADIAAQISAVHNTASWKSALLAAAPLLISMAWTLLRWAFVPSILTRPFGLIIGTVFAVGTIREFVRSRRPIWMATWLAAFMSSVTSIINIMPLKHGSFTQTQYMHLFTIMVFPLAEWSILCMVACWRSRILRLWSVAAALISTFFILYAAPIIISVSIRGASTLGNSLFNYNLAVMSLILIGYLLKLLFGLGVFNRHPYGTASHTSLFLLALYALPGYIGLAYGSWHTGYIIFKLLGWVAFALAIIAFTRTSSTRMKLSILIWGMLIGGLIASFSLAFTLTTIKPTNTAPIIIAQAVYQILPYTLLAISPLIWDLWRKKRQRMEIAE